MTEKRPLALCFGEILWDSLPDGVFPGGAPFNVAYHLHHQGVGVHLVSAVGSDWLGDELLRRLQGWGLTTEGVARLNSWPTGTVRASLSREGDATYAIAADVAWDRIPTDEATLLVAGQADALIYGSLALRSEHNQAALARLLAALPVDALKGFDVNLRPPYDNLDRVRDLASHATLLKLNSSEAARLAGGNSERPGDEENYARRLSEENNDAIVCITAGARGAGLFREGRWTWEPCHPVTAADTVGAGDAFFASLIASFLLPNAPSDQETLARACRLGEWVASQRGATPTYERTE